MKQFHIYFHILHVNIHYISFKKQLYPWFLQSTRTVVNATTNRVSFCVNNINLSTLIWSTLPGQSNGVLCMNIGPKKTKFNSCYFLKNYLISKSIKEHAHDWYINWSAKQIFLSLKILGGLLRIRKTGVSIICTNKNLVQQHVFFRWSC